MVPILDSQGDYVLGFGGRVLTTSDEEQKSSFKAPKYLNSPESVVFQKKFILFGQQTAKKAVQSLRSDRRSVIIVEGYMDAISLWDAGVCEVVASMGTALSQEQLASAAKLVGGKGGEFISTHNWSASSEISYALLQVR
jgi:DNA primase